MQWQQRIVSGSADQPAQQDFMDMSTGGRDGEKMRLVRHQQIGVAMKHDFTDRDRRFIGNFPVVMRFKPDSIRRSRHWR